MAGEIELGSIHHVRLTVTDIERSRAFYTGLLGFNVAAEAPASDDPKSDPSYPVLWGGCVMTRGTHPTTRSEEHTSELQSRGHIVCRLLLEKKKTATKET